MQSETLKNGVTLIYCKTTIMKFAIYKFELVRADQQELFKDGECVGENPQEYLDKLLDAARLNLYRTKKNGETAVYPNDILKVR